LLFPNENENACGQRNNIEQENGRSDIQAKPQQAVDDQVNRQQNHTDTFVDFHVRKVTAKDTENTEQKGSEAEILKSEA